jgi:two-component system, OmpR family, sensor histidine kinase MtrB
MRTVHAAPVGYLPPPGASPAAVNPSAWTQAAGSRATVAGDPLVAGNTGSVPRRRGPRLSTRVTLSFGIVALLAGIGLTALTYLIARTSLIDQRESSARVQAFTNARDLQLAADDGGTINQAFFALPLDAGGFAVLTEPRLNSRVGFSEEAFPAQLRTAVAAGFSATERFTLDGDPYLGVGVHIAAYDTGYLEAFPLDDTERTLGIVLTALLVGVVVTTAVATFGGWSTSRRLLRPLSDVADAAGDIAEGALGARLPAAADPDLDRLAGSFNDMADAVQTRIEREERFASDVSHELRSPITALTAAIEVLDARRADLPDRTQQALDVVVDQVRRFDSMVLDLLELSRIDAGATDLHTESVDVADLCVRIAHRSGHRDVPVEVSLDAPDAARLDKVRFERILTNLLDNAKHHGGGPTRISIERGPLATVAIAVEDAGPGVAASEKSRIFERFARGSAARHRTGSGLGLALVAEHAFALGGETWVEDRPGGGARFVVTVPADGAR